MPDGFLGLLEDLEGGRYIACASVHHVIVSVTQTHTVVSSHQLRPLPPALLKVGIITHLVWVR